MNWQDMKMKISELIRELKIAEETHGDIDINVEFTYTEDRGGDGFMESKNISTKISVFKEKLFVIEIDETIKW